MSNSKPAVSLADLVSGLLGWLVCSSKHWPETSRLTLMAEADSLDHLPASAREFTTTHWSVVLSARDGTSTQAHTALAQLCRTYWYRLYAYVRRQGHSAHDAQDLTQGFFAHLYAQRSLSATAFGYHDPPYRTRPVAFGPEFFPQLLQPPLPFGSNRS